MRSQEEKSALPYWHTVVLLLCFGWVAIWTYRTALTPIYAEMQDSIGPASDADLGAITSVYFVAYTGMQIPFGHLVDRFGPKVVLIPGFLLFALAAFLVGSAGGMPLIYLGSLLAGLGTGAYFGAAFTLSAAAIPKSRLTFSNALINSGSALGMAFGLIGSSLLVKTLGLSWNSMLYLIGAMILLAACLFEVFIKSEKDTDKAKNTSGEAPADEGRQAPDGKNALFSLASISCYALDFATCYGYYVLVAWLPNFLETERGFTGMAVGASAALIAFSAIPGALFFGRKADRFRHRRNLLLCLLEAAAAGIFLFIVLAPTPALLMAGLIAYGLIGKLTVEPILISYVVDHAPGGRTATHLTTFNFFGIASSISAPLITGLLSDAFHSKVGGFYVAAALLVAATLFFALVNKKRR